MNKELEGKLGAFSKKIAEDSDYAAEYRSMSLEEKARALHGEGFTLADLAQLIAIRNDPEQARTMSVAAGTFWAP